MVGRTRYLVTGRWFILVKAKTPGTLDLGTVEETGVQVSDRKWSRDKSTKGVTTSDTTKEESYKNFWYEEYQVDAREDGKGIYGSKEEELLV